MSTAGIPVPWFATMLILTGVVLTAPVSTGLAQARWTRRAPRPALMLWQAVCLAAGFSVVAGLVLLTVEPFGTALLPAAWNWFGALFTGRLSEPVWRAGCGVLAASLTALLLGVLTRTALVTRRRRNAHREVLDLLTTPAGAAGAVAARTVGRAALRILDHRAAVAYTVPGWRSRVVLSAGLIDLLSEPELAAVIEHERAHLRARHDVLVLPFQAWAVALGWVPGVRPAGRSVAELTEMLADDVATARSSAGALSAALVKVALSGAGPRSPELDHAPAIAGTAVADRVSRLIQPHPLARWQIGVVYLACAALLAIPASVLLLHWA